MDKSTLPKNESLLLGLGYVRFVFNGVLHKELAMALLLDTDTKNEIVFQKVKTCFGKN